MNDLERAWAALAKAADNLRSLTGKSVETGRSTLGFAIRCSWSVKHSEDRMSGKTWTWRLYSEALGAHATSGEYLSKAVCLRDANAVAKEAGWKVYADE